MRCCSVDCAALPSLAPYLCLQVFPGAKVAAATLLSGSPGAHGAARSQAVISDSGVWGHTWACLSRGWWGRVAGLQAVTGSHVTGAAVTVIAALWTPGEGQMGIAWRQSLNFLAAQKRLGSTGFIPQHSPLRRSKGHLMGWCGRSGV